MTCGNCFQNRRKRFLVKHRRLNRILFASLRSFWSFVRHSKAQSIVSHWALQLRSGDINPIGTLWNVPGVEALVHAGHLWLRGNELDDHTRQLLVSIPCLGRFEVLDSDALRREGQRVPLGHLPTGRWKKLRDWVEVQMPSSSIPARQHPRIEVKLVPCTETYAPNVLLTDLTTWVQYAQAAPAVRLRSCQFAVNADQRVLIHGQPLPPITGERAVARSGLVVPCGWTWTPAVDAALLASAWEIEPGDLWLFWPNRPLERIAAEHLIAANHSAVRKTWEARQHAR